MNPKARRAAAIIVGITLSTAALITLTSTAGIKPPTVEETAASPIIQPRATNGPSGQVDADLWAINGDTEAAFGIVRGSSVNDEPLVAADAFLDGQLYVGRYGIRSISDGVDWSGSGESRSYLRLLHGHFILTDLLKAYLATGDEDYLDAAFAHVQSWEAENSIDDPASIMAWHDETTARRLVSWLGLLTASADYSDEETVDALWASAADHAALLATAEFHATGTNHGMFQDQALLAYAAVSPDRAGSFAHLEIARARLLAYFDNVISSGGVHLEHSPAYHQVIASSILNYQQYFDLVGDRSTAQTLAATARAMARYATHVIQPDGTLPLIGDTFEHSLPRQGLFDSAEYQYASTAGLEGDKPIDTDAVFPEAGYAILRDQWATGGRGTYVHFTAAYHGSYHKHSDDLSVWVYHDGELLTESGPNGYDYDDPVTQFAYSSAAHNTLLVNGEGLPRVDGKVGDTYLSSYEIGDEVSSATGTTTRYEGVRHTRTVLLDRSEANLTVTDRIETDEPRQFRLLWHVAPEVDADVATNGEVLLSRSGHLVARVSVESGEADVDTSVVPDDPVAVRSLRLGGGLPKPTSVIVIEFQTDEAIEIVTSIGLSG